MLDILLIYYVPHNKFVVGCVVKYVINLLYKYGVKYLSSGENKETIIFPNIIEGNIFDSINSIISNIITWKQHCWMPIKLMRPKKNI